VLDTISTPLIASTETFWDKNKKNLIFFSQNGEFGTEFALLKAYLTNNLFIYLRTPTAGLNGKKMKKYKIYLVIHETSYSREVKEFEFSTKENADQFIALMKSEGYEITQFGNEGYLG
jgi:hypothetical protein